MWAGTSPISASALLLVLRHFCYVGRHVSDQCFGTPASATALLLRGQARSDQCFNTPASATALLLRGQARSDQCFSTPALCFGTLVLYSTFGYLLCCVLLISYYRSTYRYFCKNIRSVVPTGTSELE